MIIDVEKMIPNAVRALYRLTMGQPTSGITERMPEHYDLTLLDPDYKLGRDIAIMRAEIEELHVKLARIPAVIAMPSPARPEKIPGGPRGTRKTETPIRGMSEILAPVRNCEPISGLPPDPPRISSTPLSGPCRNRARWRYPLGLVRDGCAPTISILWPGLSSRASDSVPTHRHDPSDYET